MDFSGKHVVVTGGTGALGTAVVASLLAAGATCTVPYVHEAEAQRFPHAGDPNVKLIAVADLADETMVAKVYGGLTLWASIHIAGGFAAGKVADTGQTALMAQIESNLVSCFLCCRAAVNAMTAGGAHRQRGGAAGAGMAQRRRHGGLYGCQSRRCRAHRGAGRGSGQRRHSGQRGGALDHGYAGEPQSHAEGGFRSMAEGRGGGGDDFVSGLTR